MSRIVIVGGHGKVALHLERILAARGDEIEALVRNPAHADDVRATGAVPVLADVEQLGVDELADLFGGADAIVWSAGAGGGDPERTYAVDRDAAIRSMDAASRAGVRRYIMVSYFGAGPDHGVPESDSFYPYAEAKAAADAYLRNTDLDWTVLGPGRLTTDDPTGHIRVGGEKGSVPRADVADAVAVALADPGTIGRTIEFAEGDDPIATALSG